MSSDRPDPSNSTGAYRHPQFLRAAFRNVLSFYYPTCIDDVYGGYVAQIDEREGYVYDGATKNLSATTRAVHNFSLACQLDGPTWCRPAAEHGLQFLDTAHYDAEHDGYDWQLSGRETEDATRSCYGHAFVLLATARAAEAGLVDDEAIERHASLIDDRFRDDEYGLYAPEATPDWSSVDEYRGQNANLHTCEAYIAAYEATETARFLDRAAELADAVTRSLARDSSGLIWEHYTRDWDPDMEYNRDDLHHPFRPWGYQPGHQMEWAKLLGLIDRHHEADWFVDRAMELFDSGIDIGWDDEFGGLYYTVAPDGDPLVEDKYGWPITEAIGASALLGEHYRKYWDWYDRLWEHAYEHFINPRFGNWYEQLTRSHERDGPNHGVGIEPGYHPVNNIAIALSVFDS